MNWVKIAAAVLSSNLFFAASCTGIMFLSAEPLKHVGGNYMSRGEPADKHMMVIASIPDPERPGSRKLTPVSLAGLPEFQSAQPDHTFVIPPGAGEVQDELTDMFTSYRVKLLGAGRVEVETDSFGSLGLNIIARYEASEREVKPLYTNTGTPMAALFFGLMGALIPGSHRDNRGQTARQLILIENDRLASVTTRVYVVGGGPLGHLRPANRRPHFYVEVNDVIFVFSPR